MPPLHTSTTAQITIEAPAIQGKNRAVTIEGILLADRPGGPRQWDIPGVYIHVPFCFHKCHYCDFYSIVDSHDRQQAFTQRLIQELNAASPVLCRSGPVETIFVGGGTPTLLAAQQWEHLLGVINRVMPHLDRREFTVEANPETVTAELADVLLSGGVNRVSIGCQSFNHHHLKTLERWHDPENVFRSVEILRQAGLANFNLDLIFAIPGQTLDDWLDDLDRTLALQPTHISCYGLMYEPNTPLTVKMKAGRIQPVEQDLEAQMYEATIDRLAAAGFEHYEISNWARQPLNPMATANRCRHNMIYWTNRNWWPLGPSASGHVEGLRWKNVPRLGEYLDGGPFPPIVDVEQLDQDGRIGEQFMLGLRLIEGMKLEEVEALLSHGRRGQQRRLAIERSLSEGYLVGLNGSLRLSRRGLLLADSVIAPLI
ncbi:MAG: radical SAM family heme chaperone HemW [Phycisphaerales bacterium]|nr:radical SAM family heme chaperone HemW [Phycisphaerales bacterium]